jgi:hypothetical protein
MSFYQELNLPSPVVNDNLLAKVNIVKLKEKSYTTIFTDVKEYLHPALLNAFDSVNISPSFIATFGVANSQTGLSMLHADITFKNNQWVKLPVAINWDLTPGETTWTWWNANGYPEIYPEQPGIEFPPQVQGTHYKSRGNKDPSGLTLIDSYKVKINQPVLYKTDIPHQISYTTTARQRIGLSVRFSLDDVPTWEHALEIFQPFFK